MPRVYLTKEDRECQRFSDFVRGELKRQDKRQEDLANCLNISRVSLSKRVNGKTRWSLSDIVQTLDFLNSSYVIGG